MKKLIILSFILFITLNANASLPIRPFNFSPALQFVFELAGSPQNYKPLKGLIKYYNQDGKFIGLRISETGVVSLDQMMGDIKHLTPRDLLNMLDKLKLDLEVQLRDAERHGWQLQKFFTDLLSLISLESLNFQIDRLRFEISKIVFK